MSNEIKECKGCGGPYKRVFYKGIVVWKATCECAVPYKEWNEETRLLQGYLDRAGIGSEYQKREWYRKDSGLLVVETDETTLLKKRYVLDNTQFVDYYNNVEFNLKCGKNVLIYGTPGNGKTTSGIYIGLSAITKHQSVVYAKCADLCKRGVEQEKYKEARLLILDDLAGHAGEGKWAIFSSVFDHRISNRLSTVWITNEDIEEVEAIHGKPFVDRINAFDYKILLSGESKRGNNGKKTSTEKE